MFEDNNHTSINDGGQPDKPENLSSTNQADSPQQQSVDELVDNLISIADGNSYGDEDTGYTLDEQQFKKEAKVALQKLLDEAIARTTDSEQNTLFSILRFLNIKHDAKAIMRVRKQWDESAAAELKALQKVKEL